MTKKILILWITNLIDIMISRLATRINGLTLQVRVDSNVTAVYACTAQNSTGIAMPF